MAKRATAPPGQQIVTIGSDKQVLAKLFDDIGPRLQQLMPAQLMRADKLFQITIHALRTTPSLAWCTKASFVSALVQASKAGLYPGVRGLAWLIPRRTGPRDAATGEKAWEAHYQLGYRGIIELAYRSPRIAALDAHVVHDGDVFAYEYGTGAYILHKPGRQKEATEPVASYAVGWIKGSDKPVFEVCEAWEIDQIKAFAGVRADRQSPWTGPFAGEMWRKVPLVRVAKRLPASEELLSAASLEDASIAGKSQGIPEEAYDLVGDLDAPPHEPQEGQGGDNGEGASELMPRDDPPGEAPGAREQG